jgi:hypothetical protein
MGIDVGSKKQKKKSKGKKKSGSSGSEADLDDAIVNVVSRKPRSRNASNGNSRSTTPTIDENAQEGNIMHGYLVFGPKFALEDAIESHACSLEALACV